MTGNASKRSQSFALTGGEQRMSYSVKDPSGYNAAMCMIYIVDKGTSLEAEGGFPEVTIDTTGPGVTELVKDAGEYYLDVKAANCQWTVTIQELR